MQKLSVFFLANSLDVKRGGLTKAVLAQTDAFANMGHDTYLLTFNFSARYDKILKELIELGQLNKKVKVINLYESLCGPEAKVKHKPETEETGCFDQRKGHNAFRIYENGLYVRYRSYHEDGSLDFIDHFNEHRYRTKKEVYDGHGHVRRVSFMDIELNKPRQIIYYNNNERAYLSKWIDPETEKSTRVNWFDKEGNIKKTYRNDDELKVKWIQRMIKGLDNPVLISDSRVTDRLMVKVKSKKAVKIWRLHSSHLLAPFEIDSEIPEKVQVGMNNLDKLDGVLVLTEQQKRDIESRFGKKNNIYVVPHAIKPKLKRTLFGKIKVNKDEKRAVVVARLSGIKNINHIIKAFKKVVDQVPEAQLDIWGEGKQKDNLIKLIKELGIKKNVSLKGYTTDPHEKYQGALFSVLASKSEGFALSVLESMSNATPVISYDIGYGPSEMIDNGINGILIEKNNIDRLAEEMITMFNDPKSAINMGKAAYKKIEDQFNERIYAENWQASILSAIENRKNKNKPKEDK